jgi:hypothetical protein
MKSVKVTRIALAVALVGVLSLMAPAAAQAAAPVGTGPDDAIAPSDATMHLDVGQNTWFTFNTGGKGANVLARLRPNIDGCAAFKVWTMERLKEFNTAPKGTKVSPVGMGNKVAYQDGAKSRTRYGGDLVWANSFKNGGTFYVQVGQTGSQPCDFSFSISGDSVSFPTAVPMLATAAQAPATAVVAAAAPAAVEKPVSPDVATNASAGPAGNSPDTAYPTPGVWRSIKDGEPDWYVVSVPGSTATNPMVVADLSVRPAGSASFTVWTPERLRQAATVANPAKNAPPVGVGTVTYCDAAKKKACYGGNPMWTGSAKEPTTFYIAVTPNGNAPVDYMLNVAAPF